jgi:hypothetical protein
MMLTKWQADIKAFKTYWNHVAAAHIKAFASRSDNGTKSKSIGVFFSFPELKRTVLRKF